MKTLVKYRLYTLIYLLVFLIAILNTFCYEKKMDSERKSFLSPKKTELTVKVKSFPSVKNDKMSFVAKCMDNTDIKCLINVNIDYAGNLELYPGDTLSLKGTVKATTEPYNTKGYDYSQYLRTQGVTTELFSEIHNISKVKKGFIRPVYVLRQKISNKIYSCLPPDEAGLVIALVTGDKSMLSQETKDYFRLSGLYHIIAVSGLHLNLVIMFISVFFATSSLRKRAKKYLSVFLTFGICVLIFLFTGLGVSIERAAFMAVVCCMAAVFMREYSPEMSLFAIAIIILLTEPYSINDTSFLLSFSATAGVLCGVRIIKKHNISERKCSVIIESVIISVCTAIFTLPFTVKIFNGFSTVSVISNLIVIPIVPLLLALSYILAISCLVFPVPITALIAHTTVTPAYLINRLARLISSIPYSYIYISDTLFILLFANIFMLFLWRILKNKKLLTAVLLITAVANFSNIFYNISDGSTEVTFLNAKQGECSVIRSSDGAVIMIDCGSEDYASFGKSEVITYLRNSGISKIDALFLTHFHEDHANGTEALIENGFVKYLLIPDRSYATDEKTLCSSVLKAATKAGIPVGFVSEGDRVVIGDNHVFDILNPSKELVATANDGSLVINYSHGGKSVLYMGDSEDKTSCRLLEKIPHSDIIKVAHHGDKNSFSNQTAERVNAEYAVISCGKDNIYGHPAKETLKSYRKSEIIRTDTEGKEIQFVIKNDKLTRRK